MKTPWIGSAAVVFVVLVIGRHYYSHGQQPPPPSAHAAVPVVQGTSFVPKPEKRPVATATAAARSAPHNYRTEFQVQQDYWAYAQQLLPRAKAGNADAQFYLGKILSFCGSVNRGFFEHLRQKITLDEALQLAAARHLSMEEVQTLYTRCHGFQTADVSSWGSEQEWFNKATDAGQPAASASIAGEILERQYLETYQKAGGHPELGEPVRPGADPDALLLTAAKSLDPEALYGIGKVKAVQQQMAHSNDATEAYAWMLVGCQRGFPCNGNFDWIMTGCPNCNPDNPTPKNNLMAELTYRGGNNNWATVQQRAKQINASLDAGRWDELGLNSTQVAGN
jgi:hypothetical protein